jgi:cellobiose phosphorylase
MNRVMIFETAVPYRSGTALYRIDRETPELYNACLISFDGTTDNTPPGEITLIRGFKSWAGSDNDEVLVNMLGSMIDEYVTNSTL